MTECVGLAQSGWGSLAFRACLSVSTPQQKTLLGITLQPHSPERDAAFWDCTAFALAPELSQLSRYTLVGSVGDMDEGEGERTAGERWSKPAEEPHTTQDDEGCWCPIAPDSFRFEGSEASNHFVRCGTNASGNAQTQAWLLHAGCLHTGIEIDAGSTRLCS